MIQDRVTPILNKLDRDAGFQVRATGEVGLGLALVSYVALAILVPICIFWELFV